MVGHKTWDWNGRSHPGCLSLSGRSHPGCLDSQKWWSCFRVPGIINTKYYLHPSILTTFWLGLLAICHNTLYPEVQDNLPPPLCKVCYFQTCIGWDQLYHGRLTTNWAQAIDTMHWHSLSLASKSQYTWSRWSGNTSYQLGNSTTSTSTRMLVTWASPTTSKLWLPSMNVVNGCHQQLKLHCFNVHSMKCLLYPQLHSELG